MRHTVFYQYQRLALAKNKNLKRTSKEESGEKAVGGERWWWWWLGGGGGLYMMVCVSLEDPGNAHVSSPVFPSSFSFLLSVVVAVVSSSSSFLHSVLSQN